MFLIDPLYVDNFLLFESDPGIADRIHEIGQDVEGAEQDGVEHQIAHDRGNVPLQHSHVAEITDSRPGEDTFNYNGAAEQVADLQGYGGNDRQYGVSEGVFQNYYALREAFRHRRL